MNEIAQIRKLSLWIFFIPLLAINLCLIISQNYEVLENTFLSVDMLGRSGFSIPYLDGSLSISRASRTFPQYLIFKPAMIFTAVILYYYWSNNNNLIKLFPNPTDGLVSLSSEDNYKIDVFDNIGKLVFTTIGNSFNIHSLEKGSYFIKLTSENNTISTYKILRK